MARFETSGLDDILLDMKRRGELSGPVADKMLMAGAEEDKQCWVDAITEADLIDKHDMINSVGFPRQPKTAGDIRQIDIYPQGTDRKGVRNAEKAFINHYGASGRPATHFVDKADEKAGPKVQAAYEKIWDEFLEGKV